MQLEGNVHVFGDHIDTDVIIPARYLNTSDPAELARHCMEDADPDFAACVQAGDLIVGGENFGCGSSREHAPIAIRAAGVQCVVARSFARIFFRNAINIGLPIFECPTLEGVRTGDRLRVDADAGEVVDLTQGRRFAIQPLPPFMKDLLEAGGLMPYIARQREQA